MKKLIYLSALTVALVPLLALFAVPRALGGTRYIAQSVGTFRGGTACNGQFAISPAIFNLIKNSPGDVNYICGTILGKAGAQLLAPKGNGTQEKPVTIKFDTGAALKAPYFASSPNGGCGGAICLYRLSYYTIDGQNTGTIENTDNGTTRAFRKPTEAVEGYYCNGCTVENLTIANMYVRNSSSDTSADVSAVRCITVSGSNWIIRNNVMHDSGWCLFNNFNSGDGNVDITRNTIFNVDHGWMLASQVAGGNSGPFRFHENIVFGYAVWDSGTANVYHHDGVHCFTSQTSGAPAHISELAIYNNLFKGPTGLNITAHVFIEGGRGPGATPCADATSGIAIYNNVAIGDQSTPDGLFGLFSGNYTPVQGGGVYNNTLVSTAGAESGVCFSANGNVSGMIFEDNIVSGCNQLIETDRIPFAPDYNQYGNGGNNAFVCQGKYYSASQLSSWQSCIKGDSHSTYKSSIYLTNNYQLQGISSTGTGVNLTSLCSGALAPLCTDYAGSPRPASGAWITGAQSKFSTSLLRGPAPQAQ